VVPVVRPGGVRVWRESGVRRWCVWQESAFSRCEDVFTFNLFYKEILYFECNLQR
jgi:hypothetical protein